MITQPVFKYLNRLSRNGGLSVLLAGLFFCVSFAASAFADTYRLTTGDKISVSVLGQKELTGDLTVDDTGSIRMLIVGELKVAGSTIPEVEREISERLADGYFKHPIVSVRISELRPLYILGAVRKAGKYAFDYGSTVKSLIALAGGIGVPDTERSNVSEYLAADQKVDELLQSRDALQIRVARLSAQRDDAASFEPKIPSDASEGLKDAIARERDAFQSEKKLLESQMATIRDQRPRLKDQIEALNGQLESETKQIDLARAQVSKYEELNSTGLLRNSTLTEYKQSQVRFESERWRILGELSRLKFDQGELDVKLNDMLTAYRQKVMTDLDASRRQLKEFDVSLPATMRIRQARLAQSGSASTSDDDFKIAVTRVEDGAPKTFDASEDSALLPGDIVEVKMNKPKDRPAAAGAAATAAPAAAAPARSGLTN